MLHVQRKNKLDLFRILVKSEMQQRYQGSLLGFIWVFLKPLLLFLVLLFVFQIFSRSDEIANYPLYLLLGILTYNFFSEGTTLGMFAILNKGHILKKVSFDRRLVLLSTVTHAALNYFFSMLIFACFCLYYGNFPSLIELGFYSYYFLLLTLLVLSLSAFLSIIVVRFRDLSNIWEVLVSILFYLSPIFYPLSLVTGRYMDWYLLNPLTVIIVNMRLLIVNHDIAHLLSSKLILLEIAALLVVGAWFFSRQVSKVIEKI